MKKIALIIFSILFLIACNRKIDEFKSNANGVDFSKFVAVGNSLMAGYADGALYHSGQANSIPNILAGQFKSVGSGSFVQPVVNSEYGVLPGKMKLGYSVDCKGVTSLAPIDDIGTLDPITSLGYPVNNFGIPGAKSFHLFYPHYGDPAGLLNKKANPYFVRFASNPATTVIQDIASANATFFTIWLGDNDVLSYALAGGASDSITSPQLFGFAMRSVVQTLIAKGAKGCIATIPDITTIPFFTTIPYNGLVLTKNQADSIMMFMTLFHLPFKFQAGANPFLIEDQNIPVLHCRQARANDLILLTVPPDSLKCKGMGIINPLTLQLNPIPNQFVLDSVEVALIKNSTEIYNDSIRNLATNYHIALVDINTKLHDIVTGIIWDGIQLNSKFVSGGTFSTDGIHLTPRGNAVAANYFIEAINGYYGCNIPEVNITSYKGLKFP